MLSKKTFIETIKLIKTKRSHEHKLIKALELCSPEEYVNAFIYTEYETLVVKLLHETMELNENNDVLEYWLWELNFGKDYKPGCFTDENDKNIDISTVGKLYDYIISIKEK